MTAKALTMFTTQLSENIGELEAALPDKRMLARFERATKTAVQREPKLLAVDRRSLFLALTQCANDGFTPDGREAAIVPFNDRKKGGSTAVYIPMTAGIVGRLRETGAVATIKAVVVTKAEIEQGRFRIFEGVEPRIEHEPLLDGDPGEMAGCYAAAKLPNGEIEFEWMAMDQILAVEKMSRAADGPWKGAFRGEMVKKTVIRRLAKRLRLPIEVREIIERDDQLYDLDLQAQPGAGSLTALRAELKGETVEEGGADDDVPRETPSDEPEFEPEPEPEPELGEAARAMIEALNKASSVPVLNKRYDEMADGAKWAGLSKDERAVVDAVHDARVDLLTQTTT